MQAAQAVIAAEMIMIPIPYDTTSSSMPVAWGATGGMAGSHICKSVVPL